MSHAAAPSPDLVQDQRDCDCCDSKIAAKKSFKLEVIIYGAGNDRIEIPVTVPVWNCDDCGESFTDWEADEIRHEAICNYLDRPSPQALRQFREKNRLSQEQFAKLGRFGIASIKRWESGEQMPTASAAQHLQLLMRPDTLSYLRERERMRTNELPAPRFRTEITDISRRQASRFELRISRSIKSEPPLIAA